MPILASCMHISESYFHRGSNTD